MKRIMVDMSATLLHHGHIRLLKKAKEYGYVVVALTLDKEIKKIKGYWPELNYHERKELLEAIRYVDEVVPSNWIIDNAFLSNHRIDHLVHGDDNSNPVSVDKLLILPRTNGVSSTAIRERVIKSQCENKKST